MTEPEFEAALAELVKRAIADGVDPPAIVTALDVEAMVLVDAIEEAAVAAGGLDP